MDARNHFKNGVYLKNQMSRSNNKRITMKANKLLTLFILNLSLFSGCNDDFDISSPKNTKLKRISGIHLGFSKEGLSYKTFVTNSETI